MDFFEVERSSHKTRNGACELPIFYRDASQFGVMYAVDLERARKAIECSAIEPWPVLGKAIAAIYVWEYRDSTVGSYGEVGLGVQARRKNSSPSLFRLIRDMGAEDDQGIWVLNLPVTTEGAFEAGVDLWGYPKYVTKIETRFESRASVALGEEIELSIASVRGPKMRAQPVVTYTKKNGRLLRTVVSVDHQVQWGFGDAELSIAGDGPLARSARALDLEHARALATFRTDHFRARLPAGVDLGPAQ